MKASHHYQGYNLFSAVKAAFSHYINFRGRATRSAFWWAYLAFWLGGAIVGAVAGKEGFFYALYTVAVVLPFLGVTVRRLHDTGRSAWNMLWYVLPLIGWIILAVLLCGDSQYGTNQYGPSEKYPD